MKNITHKELDVAGRKIHVFDGAVDFSEREHLYTFMRHSHYLIGNEDADAIETSQHKYLCSHYSMDDVKASGLFDAVKGTDVLPLVEGLLLTRAHVNLSTPTDNHWCHDHRGQNVLLYYGNKHWKHEWAGETLFFNDDLSEVVYASVYKPGRIIVFDGEIPHTVRPQSSSAPQYRFTLSLFFNRLQ